MQKRRQRQATLSSMAARMMPPAKSTAQRQRQQQGSLSSFLLNSPNSQGRASRLLLPWEQEHGAAEVRPRLPGTRATNGSAFGDCPLCGRSVALALLPAHVAACGQPAQSARKGQRVPIVANVGMQARDGAHHSRGSAYAACPICLQQVAVMLMDDHMAREHDNEHDSRHDIECGGEQGGTVCAGGAGGKRGIEKEMEEGGAQGAACYTPGQPEGRYLATDFISESEEQAILMALGIDLAKDVDNDCDRCAGDDDDRKGDANTDADADVDNGGGSTGSAGTSTTCVWRVMQRNSCPCPTPALGCLWGVNVDIDRRGLREDPRQPMPSFLLPVVARVEQLMASILRHRARQRGALQQALLPLDMQGEAAQTKPGTGGSRRGALSTVRVNGCNAIAYRRAYGHCLKAHIDDRQLSAEPIATLSLGGSATMTFAHEVRKGVHESRACPQSTRVLLPRRSLQVITGAARYNYTHEIRNEDLHDDLRVSITFRDSRARAPKRTSG